MGHYLISLPVVLLLSMSTFGQVEVQNPKSISETDPIGKDTSYVHKFVDEPAEFPGGMKAMKKYLKSKLVRPESVVSGKIAGFCFTQFTVERDGSFTNLRIVRGVTDCPECDAEALRVIQNMPKWKPAKTNGEIVRYLFNLPIVFKP
jgi:protein TonB